jgi:glycosyltransferase involved in cell wall biosynthesis
MGAEIRRDDSSKELKPPFISYILPVHNAWPYMMYAVESILAISSEDFELIISDNQSSDSTKDYLKGISDSRVRVISPSEKLKMNANFEFAISHATGEWVQLIGGDDAVMPWHYQALRKLSLSYPDIQVVNWNRGYYFWGEAQESNGSLVASIEISARVRVYDSAKRLKQAMRGTISILDLPQLYTTSAVKRDLISKASTKTQNTFVVGMQPDIFSSIQILFNAPKFLRIDSPLTLVGTSPKSNAAEALGDFYKVESSLVYQQGNCRSIMNARTSISLFTHRNSAYYLIDSMFDYFDSAGIADERKLMMMGYASFLSDAYMRSDRALQSEIIRSFRDNFPNSFFTYVQFRTLSFLYLLTNPIIKFANRLKYFVMKKFIFRLDYKKISYKSNEFSSIRNFIELIPQEKITLLRKGAI